MKKSQFFLVVIFLANFFYLPNANAQNDLLPLDKTVRYAKLANGFSYYVRKNPSAKNIVSVSFVVKAGFLQEDEDQLEVSHWLEHVTLTSSKNYPEGAFYYLKKLGMRMGDQLNASTGYLYTHYQFNIPSDSVNAISLALSIAKDISTNANFNDLSVSTEQSAVVSERLGAMGIGQREIDNVIPKLFGNSYYAKRGVGAFSFEAFKKIPKENLVRFYHDWYRPDLEAIMVVGDINEEKVVREIEQLFSSIPVPNRARPYIDYQQFDKGKPKYLLHTDPQMQDLTITMYNRFPEKEFSTMAHLERLVKRELFGELMRRRFADRKTSSVDGSKRVDYLYLREGLASISGINVGRMIAHPKYASDIESIAIDMIRESHRVVQFGFLADELTDAKLRLEVRMQSDSDKSSNAFIQDYIDHMTRGYAYLSPEFYSTQFRDILSGLDLSIMNKFTKQILVEVDPDVVILAPDSKKDSLPSKAQWTSFNQKALMTPLSEYVRAKKVEYAVTIPVSKVPVSVLSRAVRSGVTELTLNNGIHIILKASKGETNNEKICVNAFSKMAVGRYADNEYHSAINSVRIIEKLREDSLKGIGVYSSLLEKGVSTRSYVDDFSVGVRGYSRVSNLDILMSRIYSYFNLPKIEKSHIEQWNFDNKLVKKEWNTLRVLADSVRSVVYENIRYIEAENRGDIDINTVTRCYREMFSDNSGAFTFLVTGNFEEEKVIPVIVRYVGALTGSKSKFVVRPDRATEYPNRVVHKKIYASDEQKARVEIRLTEPLEYNASNIFGSRFVEWFLQKKLISRLREKEGGIYGISVSGKMFPGSKDRLVISIGFECPVDKAQELLSAARNEIDKISKQGASSSDISEYLAYARQNKDTLIRENFYWKNLIDEVHYLGDGLSDISKIIDMDNNGLKNFDVNHFLRNTLSVDRLSDIVMLPSI